MRAAAPAAEPVVAQVQVRVLLEAQVRVQVRAQVVRAPQEPEPADPRVMAAAEVQELAAVVTSAMLSAADKALPALRVCATRGLRHLAATSPGTSRTIDQAVSNVDYDQVPHPFFKLLKDRSLSTFK